MTRKTETTKLGNKDYASVAQRIKEFRADHPNSKILSREITLENGDVIFKAYIWRDRDTYISGDLDSADSDGMAKAPAKSFEKEKQFEKLQTIAIGRALAILGYLASGEIASFEEMEEFLRDKEEKRQAYIQEQVELFDHAKSIDELKELWATTNKVEPAIIAAKDKRKAELEAKNANN